MKLGKIFKGAILVTADVVGLYPSIPHKDGLDAIESFWKSHGDSKEKEK